MGQEMSQKERRAMEKDEKRQEAEAFHRRSNLVTAAVSLFCVLVVVGFFYGLTRLKKSDNQEDAKVGTKIGEMGRRHIAVGEAHEAYNSNPPTSGPHYAEQHEWGVYDQPAEEEQFVHNLEHGGILFLYKDLDAETLPRLKGLVEDLEKINGRVLMAPYPKLQDARIALTAWEWLDKLQSYDEKRIRDFFTAHVDRGPEKVPITDHQD